MSVDDALLFIDANKYLDLYRTIRGKTQLAALAEQADNIFVTRQVVEEVQRNKINEAADFLKRQLTELKLPNLRGFDVPDHLFGADANDSKKIREKKDAVAKAITQINDDLQELVASILDQIHQSQDDVSKTLAPIFAKAAEHTPAELQRAIERRDRGRPPGKKSDPVGDQLSWEQLLSQFPTKTALFIISRDRDFGAFFDDKGFLNLFLYDELRELNAHASAFLFEDIPSGIKAFADATGVKADKLPSPEETNEIKREERTLRPLGIDDESAPFNMMNPPSGQTWQHWYYRSQPHIVMPDEEMPFPGSVIITRGPTPPSG